MTRPYFQRYTGLNGNYYRIVPFYLPYADKKRTIVIGTQLYYRRSVELLTAVVRQGVIMQSITDLGTYTFSSLLKNSVSKFSDRPAFGYVGQKMITYREFGMRVSEIRDLLYAVGVDSGDRVAIYSPSSPYWGACYFAIVTMGAIAVPLLPDFSSKEVDTCLKHSTTRVVLAAEKLVERLPLTQDGGLEVVIRIEDLLVLHGNKPRSGQPPLPEISENDTASIIYTSGTTGRSKGVELSHKNLIWNAIGGQFFQRINKFDVGLSILPMSHVYEFTIGFLMFFLNGASVRYLEKPPTVTTLLPALKTVRPTLILSVPIIMEKIYKNKIVPTFTKKESLKKLYSKPFFRKILHRLAGKSLKKTFGGRLKFFGIGGARVDPVVEQFMKEARFPYAIGYGLTETAPLLAGSGPRVTKPGEIGPVMPGVTLKLLDPDPVTGIGEVLAKGPNVMKGYYRDPELTASVFTDDGWFRTGDLGSMDATGRLALKGRSKNMILGSSGENIYPEDIEFVLNQHPLVLESLVVEGENSSLVALVQVDEEKLAAEARKRLEEEGKLQPQSMTAVVGEAVSGMGEAVSGAVSDFSQMLAYKREQVLNEIRFFVNGNVNKISRIDRVESVPQFEKTASQKIKRYLYSLKKTLQGDHHGGEPHQG